MVYFVSYRWRYRKRPDWNYCEEIIEEHPIGWLVQLREADKEEAEEHHIIFWAEIPRTLAVEHRGKFC